jgi:hypothetical protein
VAATVVGLLVVPVGADQVAAGAAVTTAPVGYVALGDSFTAGPLIPLQLDDPAGCLRSNQNYPHVVARTLHLALTDDSCSGATTANMAGSQSIEGGTNRPQFAGLTSTTSVVSIGIGGDDIGYLSILEHCLALTPFGPTRVGRTCQSHYDAGGQDQLAAAIQATAPKVAVVLQRIHRLSPRATVVLVGYPDLLPATGSGCWPRMPLTRSDVPYLRSTEAELNQMLATVAAANATTFVSTSTQSAPHTTCAARSTRWVEPLVPTNLAAPVHPNARGEAGMAVIVARALQRLGVA